MTDDWLISLEGIQKIQSIHWHTAHDVHCERTAGLNMYAEKTRRRLKHTSKSQEPTDHVRIFQAELNLDSWLSSQIPGLRLWKMWIISSHRIHSDHKGQKQACTSMCKRMCKNYRPWNERGSTYRARYPLVITCYIMGFKSYRIEPVSMKCVVITAIQ